MSQTGSIHWIASYPKSGNTLVRLMLTGLLFNRRVPLADLQQDAIASMRHRFRKRFAANEGGTGWDAMLPKLHQLQKEACARGDVFLKTHAAAIKIGGRHYFDWGRTGSFIYILRDPREVAVSYAYHMKIEIADAIARLSMESNLLEDDGWIVEPLTTWSNHAASWLSAPKGVSRIALRFEDLVADRRKAIGQFNDFYAFGRSAAEMDAIADAVSFDTLQAEEAEKGFVEGVPGLAFFRKGETASWRDEDPALFEPIVAQHGALMRRFGYLAE